MYLSSNRIEAIGFKYGAEGATFVLENKGVKEWRYAMFNADLTHRYVLAIIWNTHKPVLNWLMLNPSTATHKKDDPTVLKCKFYAKEWGYGGIVVTNIFSYRATEPKVMRWYYTYSQTSDMAFDRNNLEIINQIAKMCERTICAWGNHGTFMGRGNKVLRQVKTCAKQVCALNINKSGEPIHPLYQPKNAGNNLLVYLPNAQNKEERG